MASEGKDETAAEAPALTSMHVRRAIEGEPGSLSWLVRRLTPLLRAQVEYRLGEKLRRIYEVDDLVNDAWLVALPKLAELPQRDGRHTPVLLRFLSTTIIYRIQNLLRRHLRGQASDLSALDAESRTISREDLRSGVVTNAVRAERHAAVHDAIADLDERDREIVLLRGIEQQSNSTVSGRRRSIRLNDVAGFLRLPADQDDAVGELHGAEPRGPGNILNQQIEVQVQWKRECELRDHCCPW